MLDLRYIFTVPCVMSLVGDLTVVHVQGRVHARAWLSSVVSSFKGTDESRADCKSLEGPSAVCPK